SLRRDVRYVHPTRSSFPSSRQRRFLSPLNHERSTHVYQSSRTHQQVRKIERSVQRHQGAGRTHAKKQAGFVDEIVLVSDAERDRLLALSFWKTREDAERYHREQYNTVREKLQHLIDAELVIRTFDVHTSTGHKIAAGKAA